MLDLEPDREPEVGPQDCALLLAVPLTWLEFAAAHADPTRDFCRQFPGAAAQTAWSLCFEQVMAIVARAATAVQRIGVTVTRNAQLRDWTEALSRHRVVTLVAHWRFVPIAAGDVVDPIALRRRAAVRDGELARVVDDALRGAGDGAAEVAAVLDALCVPAVRRYSATDRRGRPEDRGINRVMLEHVLPGLRHASAIELADRMHTAAELVDATPYDYPGVIDLSVCNSIVLAELLKRARRPALVASGEFRASLAFRMIRYRVLIEQLHRRKARYTDVLQQLARR